MLKRLFLILLTLTSTVYAADPASIDLDSLFVESVGGPEAVDSLRRLTSYRAEGTMDLMGNVGRFVEYYVPPDKFYSRIEIGPMTMVQAFDGHTAWQIDMNGQVSEVEGFERDEILKGAYFNSHSYLFPDRFEGSYEYQGLKTEDGIDYHVVRFKPLNKSEVIAYFDAATGLMSKSTGYMDELVMHTYRRNPIRTGGILFPTEVDVIAEGAPVTMKARYESIVLNEPVDPGIFRMPNESVAASGFPEGADSVMVPFLYQAGHIRIPVIVNGKTKLWMILDSGASANIFNKPVIDSLGFKPAGKMAAKGVADYEEVDMVKIDSVSIGSILLRDQVAGALDLSALTFDTPDGAPFGGVIGYDFLSRYPILIDYSGLTLTVYNPDRFTPHDSGVEIGFHLTMRIPTLQGELNGIKGDFIVDLGNSFGLILHDHFAQTHNLDSLLDNVQPIPHQIGGVGGTISGRTAYAASFKIGGVMLNSLKVIIPDSGGGLAGSEELAGNIGNLVLENFKILLDYRNSRIIFYGADADDNK